MLCDDVEGWDAGRRGKVKREGISIYIYFQLFKLDLEKAKEQEIKLPTSTGAQKKQENSRKTFASALLNTLKPLTVWITTNCGKFLKRWK